MSKTTLDYIREIEKLESKCIREMEWKRDWMNRASKLEAQNAELKRSANLEADKFMHAYTQLDMQREAEAKGFAAYRDKVEAQQEATAERLAKAEAKARVLADALTGGKMFFQPSRKGKEGRIAVALKWAEQQVEKE